MSLDHLSCQTIVRIQQLAPALVPEPRCSSFRSDQPRDQQGGQDAMGVGRRALASEKLLDLVNHAIDIAGPDRMIATGKLDETRA